MEPTLHQMLECLSDPATRMRLATENRPHFLRLLSGVRDACREQQVDVPFWLSGLLETPAPDVPGGNDDDDED